MVICSFWYWWFLLVEVKHKKASRSAATFAFFLLLSSPPSTVLSCLATQASTLSSDSYLCSHLSPGSPPPFWLVHFISYCSALMEMVCPLEKNLPRLSLPAFIFLSSELLLQHMVTIIGLALIYGLYVSMYLSTLHFLLNYGSQTPCY